MKLILEKIVSATMQWLEAPQLQRLHSQPGASDQYAAHSCVRDSQRGAVSNSTAQSTRSIYIVFKISDVSETLGHSKIGSITS